MFTVTINFAPDPQAGSVFTLTWKTPRFPEPVLVVTERMLEPFPSSLTSDSPRTRLFPFPAKDALMVRTPVALVSVTVDVPVLLVLTLWLNVNELGLSVTKH